MNYNFSHMCFIHVLHNNNNNNNNVGYFLTCAFSSLHENGHMKIYYIRRHLCINFLKPIVKKGHYNDVVLCVLCK